MVCVHFTELRGGIRKLKFVGHIVRKSEAKWKKFQISVQRYLESMNLWSTLKSVSGERKVTRLDRVLTGWVNWIILNFHPGLEPSSPSSRKYKNSIAKECHIVAELIYPA